MGSPPLQQESDYWSAVAFGIFASIWPSIWLTLVVSAEPGITAETPSSIL